MIKLDQIQETGDVMNLGKRIAARLTELGWSRNDLLERVPELTPQSLSALITRDSKRSEHDVEIARALGVSLVWLNSGKGDKLNGEEQIHPTSDEILNIPLCAEIKDPGTACILPVHNGMSIHKTWVSVFFPDLSSTDSLGIMPVSGFGMAPTFAAGDLLLVDFSVKAVEVDGIYVFKVGESTKIKRMQLRPDNSMLITSDNPQYEPMVIPPENVANLQILGRVIYTWTGKRL